MLNRKYRPLLFSEVEGQELPKKVLSAVCKSPKGKPQVYILQGSFGSGKTTLARVFGKGSNCQAPSPPCGFCLSCSTPILEDDRYQEEDSAMMGSVKAIRELRESWAFLSMKETRVYVFDEFQMVSREGQSALLEVTENPPSNVFYLFCTTDVERSIKPLVSRSVVLDFMEVSSEGVRFFIAFKYPEGLPFKPFRPDLPGSRRYD